MADNNLIAPSRTPGWIRVLVHGLFVGAFKRMTDDKVLLEIASLKGPIAGHQLSLTVWDRSNPNPVFEGSVGENSVASLDINDPDGVYTYQQTGEFEGEEKDDRFDFRWIADFERDFYPNEKCGKRELGLRFQLNEGLAFTLLRSVPLLRSQDGRMPAKWRRIAQVMAVEIQYKSGKQAELKVDDRSFAFDRLTQYNVVLRNDCGGQCSMSEVSDFSKLFRTVVKPSGTPDFVVYKVPFIDNIARMVMNEEVRGLGGMFGPLDGVLRGFGGIFNPRPFDGGDSAIDPCGEGFFGKSNGLDDQP